MDIQVVNRPKVYPYRPLYHGIKRTLDVLACLALAPFILPVMLVCAIAIRMDSPGPAILRQKRIGRGGRVFQLYKLRTMYYNLDDRNCRDAMRAYVRGENGANGRKETTYKPANENQITRVGRLLRKTSLDEVPQLLNVLLGQMSIVGPRPNVLWEVEEYRPWHHERLEVLPGITGLAQVYGRSTIDFATLVRHDIQYIEHRSISLDLKILLLTFTSIIKGKGAK
jgi:lipopolysaccharide/colanic/teichoic acid biosynthesis glycosyltransferase